MGVESLVECIRMHSHCAFADDSTPILLTILLMNLLPFYFHSTAILLVILVPFWWLYSHFGHCTPILLVILLPLFWCIYTHSTDDPFPIRFNSI